VLFFLSLNANAFKFDLSPNYRRSLHAAGTVTLIYQRKHEQSESNDDDVAMLLCRIPFEALELRPFRLKSVNQISLQKLFAALPKGALDE
jgi:hypothetical protein